MGYPHPSHPRETVVLSKHFGDPAARTFQGWVQRGGYQAIRKVLDSKIIPIRQAAPTGLAAMERVTP